MATCMDPIVSLPALLDEDEDDEIWNMLIPPPPVKAATAATAPVPTAPVPVPSTTPAEETAATTTTTPPPSSSSCAKPHHKGSAHVLSDAVKAALDAPIGMSLPDLGKAIVRDDKIPRGLDIVRRVLEVTDKTSVSIEYRRGGSVFGAFSARLQDDGALKIKCLECGTDVPCVLRQLESHVMSGERTKKEAELLHLTLDEGGTTASLKQIFDEAKKHLPGGSMPKRKAPSSGRREEPAPPPKRANKGERVLTFADGILRLGKLFNAIDKAADIVHSCQKSSSSDIGFVMSFIDDYYYDDTYERAFASIEGKDFFRDIYETSEGSDSKIKTVCRSTLSRLLFKIPLATLFARRAILADEDDTCEERLEQVSRIAFAAKSACERMFSSYAEGIAFAFEDAEIDGIGKIVSKMMDVARGVLSQRRHLEDVEALKAFRHELETMDQRLEEVMKGQVGSEPLKALVSEAEDVAGRV